jgi:1,4-alpha-glucan branching enzyme
MNKYLLYTLLLLFAACSKDTPLPYPPEPDPLPEPAPGPTEIKDGFNYDPASPDADKTLKVTFKAGSSSALYGYTGDVYLHTGVVSEGTWLYVPAAWDENLAKCKMTKEADNVWSLSLTPTIRQWFSSGETPVNQLGFVIRSADGSRKGIDTDAFVGVTDGQYAAFQPGAIVERALPAGMEPGINVTDNNTLVTLVLYDQDKNGAHKDYAHVVGDFNNWTLSNNEKSRMYRDNSAGCWWITLTDLDPKREYAFQYYVGTVREGSMRLADAYSEKILDPDNDPSIPSSTYPEAKTYPAKGIGIVSTFQMQQEQYTWSTFDFQIADSKNLLIYELLIRDFTTQGDVNGVISKLDYLKTLGVNAIELMPVQEFDGNDSWGYNPCFYFAPDKAYGTRNRYKALIDACHQRGMAVILDVVYNHASGAHPFARLYWNSSTGKPAANNPWFNVDAPHPYSVFCDFNHESPLVREFVKRNLRFLLNEYHVDGFRFDLSKGFTQQQSTEATASNYDQSRINILSDYARTIHEVNPHAAVILEHFAVETEEAALSQAGCLLWRNKNDAYCQSGMGYSDRSDFGGLITVGTPLTEGAWVGYMESHDEERVGYKQSQWGDGVLKTNLTARTSQLATNAAFFFTLCGPKMVWQFGELGYDYSINSNPEGTTVADEYRTARKPIRWDYYDNADRRSLYTAYSRLMKLRGSYTQLFGQAAFKDWQVSNSNWSGGRFLTLESIDGKKLVLVGNFTQTAINPSLTFPTDGTWYDFTADGTPLTVSSPQVVNVPAHTYRLYTNFEVE